MGRWKSQLRHGVQAPLRGRGWELAPYPHPEGQEWSWRKAVHQLKVDHVLDVGAHHGETVRLLRERVGYAGPVTSFECAPRALAVLVPKVAADPLWDLVALALGDQRGEATFTEYDNGPMSSLHPPSDFSAKEWRFSASREVTVSVERLDTVMPAADRALLKIDTQGHDLAVLRGAAAVLDRVVAVQMEMSVTPLYRGAASLTEQLSALEDAGFEPVGFWPAVRRNAAGTSDDDLRVVEFDCLLVRRQAMAPG